MSETRSAIAALGPGDIDRWLDDGFLVQRNALPERLVASLDDAVAEVEAWAARQRDEDDAPGLHHWEQTVDGPALARSEDLLTQPVLASLLTESPLVSTAGELLGETTLLFKEKVNYKHPGGAGFAPHQDAAAYRFGTRHVSCMVPLDPATVASGCLWVVPGRRDDLLPSTPGGRVEPSIADGLDWTSVPVQPGDLLWFDSFTPHRSGTNESTHPRRALYLTYSAAREGDLRATYYADKRAEFEASGSRAADGSVRISITDDYLGQPVESDR